jgi:hypothetical protein
VQERRLNSFDDGGSGSPTASAASFTAGATSRGGNCGDGGTKKSSDRRPNGYNEASQTRMAAKLRTAVFKVIELKKGVDQDTWEAETDRQQLLTAANIVCRLVADQTRSSIYLYTPPHQGRVSETWTHTTGGASRFDGCFRDVQTGSHASWETLNTSYVFQPLILLCTNLHRPYTACSLYPAQCVFPTSMKVWVRMTVRSPFTHYAFCQTPLKVAEISSISIL